MASPENRWITSGILRLPAGRLQDENIEKDIFLGVASGRRQAWDCAASPEKNYSPQRRFRRREINEKGETIQFYNPLFFPSASASLR
jgi:hypothetical protein